MVVEYDEKFICNKAQRCIRGKDADCGGRHPHDACNECNRCPVDKTSECVRMKVIRK